MANNIINQNDKPPQALIEEYTSQLQEFNLELENIAWKQDSTAESAVLEYRNALEDIERFDSILANISCGNDLYSKRDFLATKSTDMVAKKNALAERYMEEKAACKAISEQLKHIKNEIIKVEQEKAEYDNKMTPSNLSLTLRLMCSKNFL